MQEVESAVTAFNRWRVLRWGERGEGKGMWKSEWQRDWKIGLELLELRLEEEGLTHVFMLTILKELNRIQW